MIGNQRQTHWGTGATGPSGDPGRAPSRGRRRAVVPAVVLALGCVPGPGCQPAAPKAGAGSAPSPMPAAHVDKEQPIYVVKPILSPEARATLAPLLKEADGLVKTAEEQLKGVQLELSRAENAVRAKLQPPAFLEDVKQRHEVARTA